MLAPPELTGSPHTSLATDLPVLVDPAELDEETDQSCAPVSFDPKALATTCAPGDAGDGTPAAVFVIGAIASSSTQMDEAASACRACAPGDADADDDAGGFNDVIRIALPKLGGEYDDDPS